MRPTSEPIDSSNNDLSWQRQRMRRPRLLPAHVSENRLPRDQSSAGNASANISVGGTTRSDDEMSPSATLGVAISDTTNLDSRTPEHACPPPMACVENETGEYTCISPEPATPAADQTMNERGGATSTAMAGGTLDEPLMGGDLSGGKPAMIIGGHQGGVDEHPGGAMPSPAPEPCRDGIQNRKRVMSIAAVSVSLLERLSVPRTQDCASGVCADVIMHRPGAEMP